MAQSLVSLLSWFECQDTTISEVYTRIKISSLKEIFELFGCEIFESDE